MNILTTRGRLCRERREDGCLLMKVESHETFGKYWENEEHFISTQSLPRMGGYHSQIKKILPGSPSLHFIVKVLCLDHLMDSSIEMGFMVLIS